jgi:hypothetical protein
LNLRCDFLVSKFAFTWVNLYRYTAYGQQQQQQQQAGGGLWAWVLWAGAVGFCTLNSFDP